MSNEISFSFSGGGWIGVCYYLGVFKYLINNSILNQKVISLGTSCGSWAATFLLYIKYKNDELKENINIDELKKEIYTFFDSMKPIPFMCKNKLIDFFKKIIPYDEGFMKYISDKLFVSVSVNKIFYLKNKIINPKTYDELIDTLIYSSMIPFFIGKNLRFLDGGITNNQPIHDEKTVKINCLYKYAADVYPSKYFNPIYILKIPPIEIRKNAEEMGYNNIRNFFEADF